MATQSGAVTERVVWSAPLDNQLQDIMYSNVLTNNGMAMKFFGQRGSSYVVRSLSATGLVLVNYDKRAKNSFQYDQYPDLPSEEFFMTQNKAGSYRIDKQDMIYGDANLTAEVMLGKIMAEVWAPYRDRYVFGKLKTAANASSTLSGRTDQYQTAGVVDAANIWSTMVDDHAKMTNFSIGTYALGEKNMRGVIAIMPISKMAMLKKDQRYTQATELSQREQIYKGNVAMVDGLKIYGVPDTYFVNSAGGTASATKLNWIFAATDVVAAPYHIEYTKMHINPTNFQGVLLQLRTIWDAHITTYGAQKILWSQNA